MAQEVSDAWKNFHVRDREGRTHIDLAGFARQELVASGVLGEDIHLSPIDTAVSQDYFSHARVTRTGEKEGRFMTIVSIRK